MKSLHHDELTLGQFYAIRTIGTFDPTGEIFKEVFATKLVETKLVLLDLLPKAGEWHTIEPGTTLTAQLHPEAWVDEYYLIVPIFMKGSPYVSFNLMIFIEITKL